MAVLFKLMPYADPGTGVAHEVAYWRLAGLYVDLGGARLLFYGWHSKELYDEGKGHVGQKEYTLPAGAISQFPDLETAIHRAAWGVALQTVEGLGPAEGEPDTRTSFFAEAVDA